MASEIHILIVGAGAVGAFYGSRLHHHEAGVKVSFICRSNYQEVKADGINIESHTFGKYKINLTACSSQLMKQPNSVHQKR
ncbi:hypothetical protein H4Q26_011954 [Puccinia striiformis f. sp. tritici PST-130]|nr:hypothetical protein H4Q26_011954 [Puccinia striiformis f. sp. tritici PST-130]